MPSGLAWAIYTEKGTIDLMLYSDGSDLAEATDPSDGDPALVSFANSADLEKATTSGAGAAGPTESGPSRTLFSRRARARMEVTEAPVDTMGLLRSGRPFHPPASLVNTCCHKCGERGHLARRCPRPNVPRNRMPKQLVLAERKSSAAPSPWSAQ